MNTKIQNPTCSKRKFYLVDGSRIIIEACVRAGADVFVGYPITPANLLYLYASQRFPIVLPAPDEITTLQWMAGFSAVGKVPVTATSFPGFALMIESINMAFMMELPMVIILAQRLGPATGTATCGAQGDVLLTRGLISGGYPVPTLCPSDFYDCWCLSASAVYIAVKFRTPVILLTSKEEVMTLKSFNLDSLPSLKPVEKVFYQKEETYKPYAPGDNFVPSFLPVGNERHQVRLNASTHDERGIIQHTSYESMENTGRLRKKIIENLNEFTFYELKEVNEAKTLLLSYGISSDSAREAERILKDKGIPVSILIAKTLIPAPDVYLEIIKKYQRVIIIEENLTGQFAEILFGTAFPENVSIIGSIGKIISPEVIVQEVLKNEQKFS